jgi:ATP-binding cassette subfamily B protein
MARATNDLNAVRMLLGPAIMYSANTIVFTVGALIFMVSISPKLTFYAFLPLPVVSIVIQYFGRLIHERFERIQAMFSDISARAQENFSGVRVIRAYVQEQAEIAGFETSNREYIGPRNRVSAVDRRPRGYQRRVDGSLDLVPRHDDHYQFVRFDECG